MNNLHYEDKKVIIDAAEIETGKWEVMKMRHDGVEIESYTTYDFNVASRIYREMVEEHTSVVKPLTGKYAKLRDDLRAALVAATVAADSVEDSGTCNMDAAALFLPRWNSKLVEQAAKEAGTFASDWTLFGKKHYVFCPKVPGHAYKREKAAEAMTAALAACGYDAFNYCQMD